jgi:hypothetical protein
MQWAWHAACMREGSNVDKILVGEGDLNACYGDWLRGVHSGFTWLRIDRWQALENVMMNFWVLAQAS